MKKLALIMALFVAAAMPAAAEAGNLKLSLWDEIAVAVPNNIHDVKGVDLGIASKTATVTGLQFDFLFAQTEYELNGVSMTWIINLANQVKGAQFGLLTKNDDLIGAQLGLVNLSMHNTTGLQCGFFNQAEYMNGLQLGFVNYAKTIDGLQIGLLNIAENGWFPAMVIVNGRF